LGFDTPAICNVMEKYLQLNLSTRTLDIVDINLFGKVQEYF